MRFTAAQYEAAIDALTVAKNQLVPDGQCCRICHDTGHQAWECGHNPLLAMAVCADVARQALELHDGLHAAEDAMDSSDQTENLCGWREDAHAFLHYAAGFDAELGRQVGPAHVFLPGESREAKEAST